MMREPSHKELAALAAVKAGTLKRIRFTSSHGPYNSGEVACFPPKVADDHIRRKVAYDIDAVDAEPEPPPLVVQAIEQEPPPPTGDPDFDDASGAHRRRRRGRR